MNLKFVLLKTKEELEDAFPVMKELRTNLSLQEFLYLNEKAHRNESYQIIAVKDGPKILGLMGYRFIHDFVHGYHLYIDDLVVTEAFRSKGLGAIMLKHAEGIARENGCKGLRLCTGIDNERGKKFYENNGWALRAFAFKKKL